MTEPVPQIYDPALNLSEDVDGKLLSSIMGYVSGCVKQLALMPQTYETYQAKLNLEVAFMWMTRAMEEGDWPKPEAAPDVETEVEIG